MADQIFVAPGLTTASVVKVGGVCYRLVGPSSAAPDTTSIDSEYSDCGSCSDCPNICAVCWDQSTYTNPAHSEPWCTYKNVAPGSCSGGVHPGAIYACLGGVWVYQGVSDCANFDYAATIGTDTPDDAQCGMLIPAEQDESKLPGHLRERLAACRGCKHLAAEGAGFRMRCNRFGKDMSILADDCEFWSREKGTAIVTPHGEGSTPNWGALAWKMIHRRPVQVACLADEVACLIDLVLSRVRCSACVADSLIYLKNHPPDLSSNEAYAHWGHRWHNEVNIKLGKRRLTFEQARDAWGWPTEWSAALAVKFPPSLTLASTASAAPAVGNMLVPHAGAGPQSGA